MTSFEDPRQAFRELSIESEEFKQGGKFITKGRESLEIVDPLTESVVTISLSNPFLAFNLRYQAVVDLSEFENNELRIVYAEKSQNPSGEMFQGIKTVYILPDAEGKLRRSVGLLNVDIFPLRWLVETFGQQVGISAEQEGPTVRFYKVGDLVNTEDALRTMFDCYLAWRLPAHQEEVVSKVQDIKTQSEWAGIICENLDEVKRLLSTYFEELGQRTSNLLGGKLVSFSRLERGLEEVDIPQDLKINSGNKNQARESQYKRLQDMLDGICEEIKRECQEIGYFSTTINSAVQSARGVKANDFTMLIEVEALNGEFLVKVQDSSGLDWTSELAKKLGKRRALESVRAQIELSEVPRERVELGELRERVELGELNEKWYIIDLGKAFKPVGLDPEWLVRQATSRSLLLRSGEPLEDPQTQVSVTLGFRHKESDAGPQLYRRGNKVYVLGTDSGGGGLILEVRINPENATAVTDEELDKMLALFNEVCNSIKNSHR